MTAKDDWYDPHGVQDHAAAEAYIAKLETELASCKKAAGELMEIWSEQYERVEADNQRLRDALRHIIDDQMGVGGTMSEYTATVAIAKNALAATETDNG